MKRDRNNKEVEYVLITKFNLNYGYIRLSSLLFYAMTLVGSMDGWMVWIHPFRPSVCPLRVLLSAACIRFSFGLTLSSTPSLNKLFFPFVCSTYLCFVVFFDDVHFIRLFFVAFFCTVRNKSHSFLCHSYFCNESPHRQQTVAWVSLLLIETNEKFLTIEMLIYWGRGWIHSFIRPSVRLFLSHVSLDGLVLLSLSFFFWKDHARYFIALHFLFLVFWNCLLRDSDLMGSSRDVLVFLCTRESNCWESSFVHCTADGLVW